MRQTWLIAGCILLLWGTAARAQSPAEPSAAQAERLAQMEDAHERANKQIVIAWQTLLAQGKAAEAFEKYVSPQFIDHSHLLRGPANHKAGYREALAMFSRMPANNTRAFTAQAIRANGDHVTIFGGLGVDIFRVVNGKITEHWDASPSVPVNLPGPRY